MALKEELGYYKALARLVSSMLIDTREGARKERTNVLPHRYDTRGVASCREMSRRMKSGKTRFEPETERQSMEWRHDIPKETGRQE